MRITVDKLACLGCLHCRDMLNTTGINGMPKMPEMAWNGWKIKRLPEGALELIRDVVSECPGEALSFDE